MCNSLSIHVVVVQWDHGTLLIWTHLDAPSFNLLMENIKWMVVLGESSLGGPLWGFLTGPCWARTAVEINPTSWPPFVLVISCCDSSLTHCTVFVHHIHFTRLRPRLRQDSCRYRVPRWSPSPVSFASCLLTCVQLFLSRPGSALRLAFEISPLPCYYAHSNICKYNGEFEY